LPLVVRLEGQNVDWGLRILKDRNLPVEIFNDMTSAVNHAVERAGRN
jgi:succinyl-CoA synthetase beta subunit